MKIKPSVALHTLGCKLNFSETSALSRQLESAGYAKKNWEEKADIYILNTCSVTENADKECKQIVRKLQQQAPASHIVIMGCYAQLKPKEIAAIPGVDLVLGANEKFNVITHIDQLLQGNQPNIGNCSIDKVVDFHPAFSLQDRTRAFLKVQDGCDYACTFCTIPLARGASRSNSIEGVLENIYLLEEQGVKEIVLTGINLGDFGKGKEGAGKTIGLQQRTENFYTLLEAIEAKSSVPRVRISSIEPNLLTTEIIELVAQSKKIMPHFHIPLQSGSNAVLKKMKRRYQRALYQEKVLTIKKLMPQAAIGVDVIVGFPSESAENFEETYSFLKGLPVSYFHVFSYSERNNTPATFIQPTVPIPTRQERSKALRNLSYTKQNTFVAENKNTVQNVLFEAFDKKGMMEGYTENYIRIAAPYKKEWANEIVEWQL